MKAPLLVPAVAVAALVALACSKPNERATPRERNLELLSTEATDSAVVSPVEAGQGTGVALVTRRLGGSMARRSVPNATPVQTALEAPPRPQITEVTSAAAPTLSEVPAPAGPLSIASSTDNGNGHSGGTAGTGSSGGEPTILIRGGIGSPRDDCKIHGIGRAGGGILINRLTPPLRGGRSPASTFSGQVRIR